MKFDRRLKTEIYKNYMINTYENGVVLVKDGEELWYDSVGEVKEFIDNYL